MVILAFSVLWTFAPSLETVCLDRKKGTGITTETSHRQLKLPQPVINSCRFTLPVWIIGNKVDA